MSLLTYDKTHKMLTKYKVGTSKSL